MTGSTLLLWCAGLLAAGGCLSWTVNRALLARAGRLLTMDAPNARSLHHRPTPRGGGIGIAAAVFLLAGPALLALGDIVLLSALLPPLAAIALVSHVDDRGSVPVLLRLAVHGAGAGWFVLAAGGLEGLTLPGREIPLGAVAGGAFTVLLVVWLTNLYNFMDGMDGLAAGMAVIGFVTLGLLGARSGDAAGALVGAAAAGAAAGFLLLNYPPARLFMGDIGSSSFGFLAGALITRGEAAAGVPAWIGMLVFAPFVVDATVTLARRAVRGERVWQAHRSHYYQRLVRLGWGHRRTVLVEYALMLGCGLSAALALRMGPAGQWLVLGGWGIGFVLLARSVGRLERAGPD